jgi:hypothetical protein
VTTILSRCDNQTDVEQALGDWERQVSGRLAKIEAIVPASRSKKRLTNLAVAARQIRTLALLTTHPGRLVTTRC